MTDREMIVTIDGPAGAGKSTAARAVAQKLGWAYLDTGAMYRAVALAAHEQGISADDETGLKNLLAEIELEVKPGQSNTIIILNGRDVTDQIREPHISSLASAVSAQGVVRSAMKDIQRRLGGKGRIVSEGRDMGTVVFPNAAVKFFLDASHQVRAKRRHDELMEKGNAPSLETVNKDMILRDKADSTRALAPLKPADDAVIVDSSGLDEAGVLDMMLEVIQKKLAPPSN